MADFLGIRQRLAPLVRMDETDSNDDTNLKNFVLSGQEEIETAYEWPFNVQRDVTLAITNATVNLGLPSDFGEIVEAWIEDDSQSPDDRWKLEENTMPMPKVKWDSVNGADPTATGERGDPETYTIEYASGTPQIILRPLPDANFTLHLAYLTRLASLSADTDTNYFTTNFPDLLVAWAMLPAFLYLNDTAAYERAMLNAERKLARVIQRVGEMSSGPTRFEMDPAVFTPMSGTRRVKGGIIVR